MKLNYGTMALAGLALLWYLWYFRALPWTLLRVVGVVILVPSLILITVARVQLGRAFSIRAKADILVTSGLYSKIRNPIYVFGTLMLAGFVLTIEKPWLLLGFLVLTPLQIYRSRNEERVLTERFGQAYLDYKRGTWF
jgi:protein-S-isoprenylcysteine O-methyltransferase Ste14